MQRGAKIALASGIVIAGLAGASLFRKPAKPADSADAEPARIDRTAPSLVEHDPAAAARLSDHVDPVSNAVESPAPSAAADAGRSPSAPPRVAADPQAAAPQGPRADENDESPVDRVGRTPRRRGRTHRVRDGDTLSMLAADYLGSSQRYLEIFEANREILKNPDLLPIGAELKIPSPDAIVRQQAQATIERPMAPLAARPSPAAAPPAGMKRTYRVKTGDTLVAIAKQFYGDGERYQEIYEANRERLQVPDDLREGLVLDIP